MFMSCFYIFYIMSLQDVGGHYFPVVTLLSVNSHASVKTIYFFNHFIHMQGTNDIKTQRINGNKRKRKDFIRI